MKIKLIADSCCDLNEVLRKKLKINLVPLSIRINEKQYLDDNKLDLNLLVEDMKNSSDYPRTSCPSPNDFIEAFKGEEDVFAVTMSSKISGTYNSAMLAKKIVLEQFGNKFIHVFDSLSASVGETLVSMKILELVKNNYEKLHVIEKINEYIKDMKTFFVLESLDNLIKSGRIGVLKGKVASMLSIKPIMRGTDEGTIDKVETVRGSKKVFKRLVDIIGEHGEKLEKKVLGIAHCNNLERAKQIKNEVLKRYNFKDIIIVETGGISTVYANEGGIIIAF